MKTIATALGVLAGSASLPAVGQETIDMSKITCDQYLGYKIIDPQQIAMWLNGYYNSKSKNTVIDVQGLQAKVQALQTYCFSHSGTTPIMQAAELLMREKRSAK